MTTLLTRFSHAFYADDLINLSITDILNVRSSGTLFAGRTASGDDYSPVPYAITEDLRLYVLTTPEASPRYYNGQLGPVHFDASRPASAFAHRVRLTGVLRPVDASNYADAVWRFAYRYPGFDLIIGSYADYVRMPMKFYLLDVGHVALVDSAMFGKQVITADVLRLQQPVAS
jgi:hypothetical protein